ncbi:ATP-binding protein [Streptomyces sp. GXMU-J15]|uniref:ATP-binding protein n=1 Tax=Streptomyces fuscus TaxID=3048495 RepID=A0ABT7JC47_9ACTN|nr:MULTISPECIES: ATP-binding protein [Streptomyces]MDL2081899.1 ATP-binding protein [Streptomyces fuscus]
MRKCATHLRTGVLVVARSATSPSKRAAANLVFQVVFNHYEKGSIILTSSEIVTSAHAPANLCQVPPGWPWVQLGSPVRRSW